MQQDYSQQNHAFLRLSASLLIIGMVGYGCMSQNGAGSSEGAQSRLFKGLFNPENNEFVDCNTQQVLYLLDSTQMIGGAAKKANMPNNAVYVELAGLTFSSDSLEMGSSYDSVLLVQQVDNVKAIDQKSTCVMPQNTSLLLLKEFGCHNIEFTNNSLFAQDEEKIAALLPGFTQQESSFDSEESTYEYRRGFGTVTFTVDTSHAITEVQFMHPSSTDQYKVRLGMSLAEAQTLRPNLKMTIDDADAPPLFSTPNSHIFYIIDTPKDKSKIDFAQTKIIGLLWRRQACK